MAIIKCPECNHEVSTLAKNCPFCGVDIRDNIKMCPDCGKYLLKNDTKCTNCDCDLTNQPNIFSSNKEDEKNVTINYPKKTTQRNKSIGVRILIVLAVLISLSAIGFLGWHFYSTQKEVNEQFNLAIESNDPNVSEQFLRNYPSSKYDEEVKKHLQILIEIKSKWLNIVNSSDVQDFIEFNLRYQNNFYADVCNNKIDSLGWVQAYGENTKEAYETYLNSFPNGLYKDKAKQCISELDKLVVTPEERDSLSTVIDSYIRCVNEGNQEAVNSMVNAKEQVNSAELLKLLRNSGSQLILQSINRVTKIPSSDVGKYNYVLRAILANTPKYQEEKINTVYMATIVLSPSMKIYSVKLQEEQ